MTHGIYIPASNQSQQLYQHHGLSPGDPRLEAGMSWRHLLTFGPGDLAPRRPKAHSMFGRLLGCIPLKRPGYSSLTLSLWPSSGCRPAALWVVAADGRVNRLRLCALILVSHPGLLGVALGQGGGCTVANGHLHNGGLARRSFGRLQFAALRQRGPRVRKTNSNDMSLRAAAAAAAAT